MQNKTLPHRYGSALEPRYSETRRPRGKNMPQLNGPNRKDVRTGVPLLLSLAEQMVPNTERRRKLC